MTASLRWLRFFFSAALLVGLSAAAIHHETSVYLIYQAKGQFMLLAGTQKLSDYAKKEGLSKEESDNIRLIEKVKKYSVDSLGYAPTQNFTNIYDQKGKPVLWVITASDQYALKPYEWYFPVLGRVSYKGFFIKELAVKEYNHLAVSGYDADIRPVSAWSTLGWLSDPVLSSMLNYSKGNLCNLLFHELFHASYYAPNSVDFNENVASFIAHKATQRFLEKEDPAALDEYLRAYSDKKVFNRYMLRCIDHLKEHYAQIRDRPDRYILKLKMISQLADSVDKLPLLDVVKYSARKKEIMKFKNAYFVDFVQYESMQDSLEQVFNKIYGRNIEKMVQDLRLN